MNPQQMAQQMKKELQAVVWPVTSGEVVFGSQQGQVSVFNGRPDERWIPPAFPFAMIVVESGTPDPDHPELIEQGFSILTGVEVAGDPLGEFAMIGSSVSTIVGSAGRGILEVASRVRAAVQDLTGDDGAKVLLSSTSTGAPETLGGRHIAVDELGLTAVCTSALHYAAPQAAVESGGTLTWAGGNKGGAGHCAGRFDFIQYRVFEESGSTPSSDPATNGTLLGGGAVTSATISGATSGNVYTVFADYNERDTTSSSISGTSGVEIGSWRAKA